VPPLRIVHGDDLIYRFFEDVLRSEPDLFARIPQLLIQTMGIWFPLDTYRTWPVLLPWVVRDSTCRGNPRRGIPDQWATPDRSGYLRDDNSLVKNLPRALYVGGPTGRRMRGSRMGSEFVAAHIWRTVSSPHLASRHPLLNSFVPNLVWLPRQIAKLTDREGSRVQQAVQAMSWTIYRTAPVDAHLTDVVASAWRLIPKPDFPLELFELSSLNWFQPTAQFYRTRSLRLQAVIDALDAADQGVTLPTRVVPPRYTAGLSHVPASARARLRTSLERFAPVPEPGTWVNRAEL
jgi:hypothetical protein